MTVLDAAKGFVKLLEVKNFAPYFRVIYCIRNDINSRVYIGQASVFTRRMIGHIKGASQDLDGKLYQACKKYGIENFSVTVLEHDLEQSSLDDRETFYIQKHDSYKNGYNKTDKAKSGIKKPIQQIDKTTGQIINVFDSISEASEVTGVKNIPGCAKGRLKSAGGYVWKFVDTSLSSKGEWPEEQRAKQRGRPTPKGFADDKPVQQLKPITREIIATYASINEAREKTGCRNISRCCRRISPTAGGYEWCYVDPEINAKYAHNEWSDEKRNQFKIPKANVPIQQIDMKTGEVIATFDNHKQARIAMDFGHISDVARGLRKHAGGYYWRYLDPPSP